MSQVSSLEKTEVAGKISRFSIVIIGPLIILLMMIAISNTYSVNAEDQKLFKEEVLKSIGTFPAEWDSVVFEDIGQRSIHLTLEYRDSPSNLDEIKSSTERVARAVLKVLADNGRNPQKEMIAVFVHSQIPEKGETETSLLRYFGKTMYDYSNDQLIFKPAKK